MIQYNKEKRYSARHIITFTQRLLQSNNEKVKTNENLNSFFSHYNFFTFLIAFPRKIFWILITHSKK